MSRVMTSHLGTANEVTLLKPNAPIMAIVSAESTLGQQGTHLPCLGGKPFKDCGLKNVVKFLLLGCISLPAVVTDI